MICYVLLLLIYVSYIYDILQQVGIYINVLKWLEFYITSLWQDYQNIFLKPAPKFNCTITEKAPLSLSMYLIPRENHISVYKTKIHWVVAKLAHFFHFVHLCWCPLSSPYILLARADHCSTHFPYVIYESN